MDERTDREARGWRNTGTRGARGWMKEQTEKPEDGETQERNERENRWMNKHRSWRMDEIKAEPEDEETLE